MRQRTRTPKFLHRFLYNVGISGITLTSYATLIEPQWVEITQHDITIKNLPSSFEGFSIVQLTDLHHSSIVTLDYLRACFWKAVRLQPDLVVLTGDYITRQEKYAEPLAQAIRRIIIEAGIPVYAVLGNHDHWNRPPENRVFTRRKRWDAIGTEPAPSKPRSENGAFPRRKRWKGDGGEVFHALTNAGIRVLMNESVLLRRGGDRLWLIGCDDFLSGDFDLERALASVPTSAEPRIFLMHNPYPIESIAHHRFDLVLSGHSHGGQISLPFVPPKIGRKYLAGLFYVGQSRLYVCRGLGVIGLPIRFMTLPEIAYFRLVGSSDGG
jgi:predicted MPP superfamily phosphohydrolase